MSEPSKHVPIEQTSVFLKFEDVADRLWKLVDGWPSYAKWTLGKQMTEAADSVGFNLVEGDGRFSDPGAIHFFHIWRGSSREMKLGIARSLRRGLLDEAAANELCRAIDHASMELNGLINFRRKTSHAKIVRDGVQPAYNLDPSFGEESS